MRTDNYMGLPGDARVFLDTNCKKVKCELVKTFPDGSKTESFWSENYREKCDVIEGAFYNKFDLFEYELKDGRKVREEVQAEPWSSGPCYFIQLVDSETGEVLFKHTQEDINNA